MWFLKASCLVFFVLLIKKSFFSRLKPVFHFYLKGFFQVMNSRFSYRWLFTQYLINFLICGIWFFLVFLYDVVLCVCVCVLVHLFNSTFYLFKYFKFSYFAFCIS